MGSGWGERLLRSVAGTTERVSVRRAQRRERETGGRGERGASGDAAGTFDGGDGTPRAAFHCLRASGAGWGDRLLLPSTRRPKCTRMMVVIVQSTIKVVKMKTTIITSCAQSYFC